MLNIAVIDIDQSKVNNKHPPVVIDNFANVFFSIAEVRRSAKHNLVGFQYAGSNAKVSRRCVANDAVESLRGNGCQLIDQGVMVKHLGLQFSLLAEKLIQTQIDHEIIQLEGQVALQVRYLQSIEHVVTCFGSNNTENSFGRHCMRLHQLRCWSRYLEFHLLSLSQRWLLHLGENTQ